MRCDPVTSVGHSQPVGTQGIASSAFCLLDALHLLDRLPAVIRNLCREVLAVEETVIRYMKRPDGQAAELLRACAQPRTGAQSDLLMSADDTIIQDLLASAPELTHGENTKLAIRGEGGCGRERSARLNTGASRARCVIPPQLVPTAVAHGCSALSLQKLVRCVAFRLCRAWIW